MSCYYKIAIACRKKPYQEIRRIIGKHGISQVKIYQNEDGIRYVYLPSLGQEIQSEIVSVLRDFNFADESDADSAYKYCLLFEDGSGDEVWNKPGYDFSLYLKIILPDGMTDITKQELEEDFRNELMVVFGNHGYVYYRTNRESAKHALKDFLERFNLDNLDLKISDAVLRDSSGNDIDRY